MAVFESRINPGSDDFARNRADMMALVGRLNEIKGRAARISERRRDRFEERGQLTPRERLARLLDPGMPFLELYGLANYLADTDDEPKSVPGASLITGIGFVAGVRCMIHVDDSGINAGAMTRSSGPKAMNCMDIAREKKLPYIHLVESAGANLMQYTVEGWAHGGGLFYRLGLLSAAGVPTFVVLHGPSTAGGAYMPGMSDYVIGIRGRGRAALGSAALVRAATGEIADEETLSGSEMHATTSGLVEYLAEDDTHGLLMMRELVGRLDWNKNCDAPAPKAVRPPKYSADELCGVVPVDYRRPYDVREVLARIVDGSDFSDFKPRYGSSTVCVQADIMGHACGIVGNNGPIDPSGATKVAQFLQLCDQAAIPVVFLHNITGYMVGTEYEHAGMIKHGSKMIQAVANIRVPKLAVHIGASFGAGNYGMCGLGFEPDFLFAWPNARTGVMGGQQAATTMTQVALQGAARKGAEVDMDTLKKQEARLVAHYDRQEDAFYTSGRLLDQGVIDPRDTRKVLGFALATCWEARHRKVQPNAFGVSRF
ncbi:MAG: carboxyl transferase domain-containing protein [Pseudomonadota bacterium]|nr:carboxyl transferase domain-containing protein [Pseudomonadota bacterium]